MRVRKIHTVLAVSVALVVVARSIESRRRGRDESPAEPFGDFVNEAHVAPEADEAVLEPVLADEPPVLTPPEATPDDAPAGVQRHRRGPLAVAAAVIVLVAVLAGTVFAVAAGAAS